MVVNEETLLGREINLSRLSSKTSLQPALLERKGEKKKLVGNESSIGSLLLNSYVA
jgi:hypothetical protein